MKKEFKILAPTGMLGYGFTREELLAGLARNPDLIAVDSGSTDSGPQKLGLGDMTCPRDNYVHDIGIMLEACYTKKVPVWISSAGGDGSNKHVDIFVDIVKEIAEKEGYHFNIGVIYADMDREFVHKKLAEHRITPCGPLEDLTDDEIDKASVIVAQMGAEPYIKAVKESPKPLDVIIGGRSYDPSPMAAAGLMAGFDPAFCWHLGKIIECGGLCAEPRQHMILGTLLEDGFTVETVTPGGKCSPVSVAAHTLYEKSHPYLLPGPGGTLDLYNCKFEQCSEFGVKVTGSRFIPKTYTVKMEGSRVVGYRAICVAGIRDSILIGQIDDYLDRLHKDVEGQFPKLNTDPAYQLIFHVYGKNGVMGDLEPDPTTVPKELCVIIETVGATQGEAIRLCNMARTGILHQNYPGRIATAGNVGLPFTPLEIPLGNVCKFTVYHLMELDDPTEVFPIKYVEVQHG